MRNYRFYLPGFRDFRDYLEHDEDYSLDVNLYLKSEYHESRDYIIPVKREKNKTNWFNRRKKSLKDSFIEDRVVTVRKNTDASSYFYAEYRENCIPEDFNGNLLVPCSYMRNKTKTR